MSSSDDNDDGPSAIGGCSDFSDVDDDGPSTSWGSKKRNKRPIISDSEDEEGNDLNKDEGDIGDSDSSDDTPGAKTCAICLGRMKTEVGSPDVCEHTFCKFCILEWAKNNPTCPQDRMTFTVVLVRKNLGGPIDKEVPVPKAKGPDVYEFTETENATYCEVCNQCDREDRLLLCDGCDLGYHLECLDPPLSQVPIEEWYCPTCVGVDVPETLSRRRGASSSVALSGSGRSRPNRSRSRRASDGQQEPRIPRTRATEIIRARIQKKRKQRRKKRKENKKQKIASGEIEDTRPPVKQLSELKYFIEGDNDVDAKHIEDPYATQLLAGATHEAARLPSQRKAEAAKRLRDFAFTPQACYSGRTKNRVIDLVNSQSESSDDVLSGILVNQTIAFSSSKKLVLTNDRKLTKQTEIEIPSVSLEKENSIMSEPLPSQKETPEKSNPDTAKDNEEEPSTSMAFKVDSSKQQPSEEGHRSMEDRFHLPRHRSPSRTSGYHSSNYRADRRYDYTHRSHHENRYTDRKENNRSGDINSMLDGHYCKYSSSKINKPSYSNSSKSRWNQEKDCRSHGGRYDQHKDRHHSRGHSSHHRNRSPEREKLRDRRQSPSIHERPHSKKSHSSQSHRSRSRSRDRVAHSSSLAGGKVRSQWSFGYFNPSDNVISRNNNSSIYPSSQQSPIKSSDTQKSNSKPSNQESTSNPMDSGSINKSKIIYESSRDNSGSVNVTQDAASSTGKTEQSVIKSLAEQDKKSSNNQGIGEPDSSNTLLSNQLISSSKSSLIKEDFNQSNSAKGEAAYTNGDDIVEKSAFSKDSKNNIEVFYTTDDDKKQISYKGKILAKKSKNIKMFSLFGESQGDGQDLSKQDDGEIGDFGKKTKILKEDTGRIDEKTAKTTKVQKKSKSDLLFGYDSDGNSSQEQEYDPKVPCSSSDNNSTDLRFSLNRSKYTSSSTDEDDEYDPFSTGKNHRENDGCEKESKGDIRKNVGYKSEVESMFGKTHDKNESETRFIKKHDKHKSTEIEKSKLANVIKDREAKYYDKHKSKETENRSKSKYTNKDAESRLQNNQDSTSKSREIGSKCINEKLQEKQNDTKEEKLPEKGKSCDKEKGKHERSKRLDKDMTDCRGEINNLDKHQQPPKDKSNTKLECLERDINISKKQMSQNNNEISQVKSKENKSIEDKYDSKANSKKDHNSKKMDLRPQDKHKIHSCSFDENVPKHDKNSKHSGEGKMSSKSSLFYCNDDEIHNNSVSKENDKEHKSSSKYKRNYDFELEKKICDSNRNYKDRHKGAKENDDRKSNNLKIDLFGEIDDISSSSCSNLVGDEYIEEKVEGNNDNQQEPEKSKATFKEEFTGLQNSAVEVDTSLSDTSYLMIGESVDYLKYQKKESRPFSSDQTSKPKPYDSKPDSERVKQQKVALQEKVVQEVKKSLDPFYRNKSITKEEYKEIVKKCVKKVVTAEYGDVIEPEKIHRLVLGYVNMFKHQRHAKLYS